MKKITFLILILTLISSVVFSQTTTTYTFDDLNVGPLNGQDNWVSVKHSAGGGVNEVDYIGPQGVVTPDQSLGVFFKHANTNYGEVATRKSTSNFSFDFSQGGIIQLELDLSNCNYWGYAFGLGYDADQNGTLLPPMIYEAVYPNPNLPTQDGGVYLIISAHKEDNDPRFHCGIVLPNNTMPVEFFLPDREPWMRFRIFIDLEANNGSGSVALFLDNGITGEFQPIPEIQGIDAGLTPGSGDRFDPNVWDAVFFLSSSHGGFDNFTITQIPAGLQTQFINFPTIPDKLISAEPFTVSATCTSGLPISYEIVSGPATIDGDLVTLTGDPGIVKIKASQGGNSTWLAAPDVVQQFEVVDPAAFVPEIKIRRPYDGTKVYAETLDPLLMVVSVDIEHPDVILVENMEFNINGEIVKCQKAGNNYFTALWEQPTYSTHIANLSTTMSGDNTYATQASFEVVSQTDNYEVLTFDGSFHISPNNHTVVGEFVFPTFIGGYNEINAYLDMNCAPGGCDTYDRVGRVKAKNIHGDYVELFKYITPFGVPCSDAVQLTDYSSVLQGLVEFTFEVVTWNSGGYLPVLNFEFIKGTPEYKYSDVVEIWNSRYDFGDYTNLQPVPPIQWNFNPNVKKSSLIVSTTGHNWSSNTAPNYSVNTGNAAEFYEATHHINIDGTKEFIQHLWPSSGSCTPNPAGCQPQNGTWTFPRAGWCPGSIAMIWNWDLTQFISNGSIDMEYIFDPDYVDLCHPNHPDCVDGTNGCPNCSAPDNPILDVSAKIVTYSNNSNLYTGNNDFKVINDLLTFNLYPNPANQKVLISADNNDKVLTANIINFLGQTVKTFQFVGSKIIDITDLPKGIYVVNIVGQRSASKKLVVN